MKKLLLVGSMLAAGSIGFNGVSFSHGGTYIGPGDTVPPGGGGGGNGGGPSTPSPSGPNAPAPGGPSTPAPSGPGAPTPGRPTGPSTGSAPSAGDPTIWQYWWGFNKAPYLNLKSHIHAGAPGTGTDDFFLGFGQEKQAKDTRKPSEETIRNVIVPALIEALKTEDKRDITTGAMIALAKIGDEQSESGVSPFEQLFLPYLSDGDQEVAETAAVALGILGNPKSVETLVSLLLDDASGRQLVRKEGGVNYRTRAFAAFGLGQIGTRSGDPAVRQRIVDVLWQVCESPRSRTRDVKVAAVTAMGLVPLELGPAGASMEAATVAPRNRSEQIAYLLEFFADEKDPNKHYMVRAHAPRAICNLMQDCADSQLKRHVVKALAPYVTKRGSKGVRELRQSASLAFGMLGDLDLDPEDVLIRQSLRTATANADAQVKNFSVLALGQVGGRPGEGDSPMAAASDVRKTLLTHLSRGKTLVKPWAGLGIGIMERGLFESGQVQSADTLGALRSALASSKTARDVGAYAIACGIALDTDSESILLAKLDHMSEDEVRGHLAIGLGLMNSQAAIEPIQAVVEKSKYRGELLKQAAISLGLLGDKAAVASLVDMLSKAKTLTTQAALASALGFIGDTTSVDPLVLMLKDGQLTDTARAFAAVALGIVADKEPLPWTAKFSVNVNYRATTETLTNGMGTGLLDIL